MSEMQLDHESQLGLLANERTSQVRCFASRFPIAWGTLKLIVLAFIVFLFTIILSIMTSSVPGRSSALMVAGSSLTIFILIVARMVQNDAFREYERATREGKWQEGVFVFQTGDVVVRFNRPFYRVEQEFAAGSVSLVQGHDRNNVVYILWSDALGHKLTFNVDCSRMVDRPSFVAAEMNKMLGLGTEADRQTGTASRDSSEAAAGLTV